MKKDNNLPYQNILKNKFFIAIVILLVAVVGLWWYQGQESGTDHVYTGEQPGLKYGKCTTNNDCAGICGDDECLRSSCVKSEGASTGTCACLGICK